MNPLKNIFGAPQSTLHAALSVLLANVLQQLIPQLAHVFVTAPGPGWMMLGTILGILPSAFAPDLMAKPSVTPPSPSSAGFVRLNTMLAMVALLGIMTAGCAWLKGSSVSGTVSGKEANVTVTAPDGSAYGVLVANQQACVTGAPFVALPASNIECQPSCGQLVQGGAIVTVNCRVKGTTGEFPVQFAIPKV